MSEFEPPPLASSKEAFNAVDEAAQFEERVFRKTVTILGLNGLMGRFREESSRGNGRLTMEAMERAVPDLPCRLRTYADWRCKSLSLWQLLNNPLRHGATRAYFQFLEETTQTGEAACLVVRINQFPDGLAFHNVYADEPEGVVVSVRCEKAEHFCVESYPNFLRRVGRGWRPSA